MEEIIFSQIVIHMGKHDESSLDMGIVAQKEKGKKDGQLIATGFLDKRNEIIINL